MISIINYGVGNLHSVNKAVEFAGGKTIITNDRKTIMDAEKLILPGVGAFEDGLIGLKSNGLLTTIQDFKKTGKPILGICLGMQLLFEKSFEKGEHKGLGIIDGEVLKFESPGIKVPQIGWNSISVTKDSKLMQKISDNSYVYFNHSYFCEPKNQNVVLTKTSYGVNFASAVEFENVYGVQFHPEKSQKIGIQIIRNFVELK